MIKCKVCNDTGVVDVDGDLNPETNQPYYVPCDCAEGEKALDYHTNPNRYN